MRVVICAAHILLLSPALCLCDSRLSEAIHADDTTRAVAVLEEHPGLANKMENGTFPLHEAVKRRSTAMLKLLIDAGAIVNAVDSEGWLSLDDAAFAGDEKSAKYLLDRGARLSLHAAVALNMVTEVNRILLAEPDAPRRELSKWVPLHWGVMHSKREVILILLAHGADPNSAGPRGETPMHLAARRGDIRILDDLWKAGANADALDTRGSAPIHFAAEKGCVEVAKWLIEKRNAIPHLISRSGTTPIELAAMWGHADVVALLLTHNPPRSALDAALRAAAAEGYPQLVAQLAEAGADVTSAETGGGALFAAIRSDQPEVISCLLMLGAPVSALDENGRTPLHIAARDGDLEIVAALVNGGADIAITDKYGASPMDLAESYDHQQVLSFLKGNEAGRGRE